MKWPLRQLADCCQVITKGTTPTSFGMPFSDSGIFFLRVQNIQQGTVELNGDTLFIDAQTHKTLERSRIQRGDVLLSIAGTIGRSAVVPESAPAELNCNQAVAIIRIQDHLDTRFLFRWLNTPDAMSQMTGGMVTGTIANLSLTQVRHLKVPAPSLTEQRRIAEVLDRAEALRAKRRAALAQLDSLTQSLFLDMFGDPMTNPKRWKTCLLEDIAKKITDGTHKTPVYKDSGIEFLSAKDLKEGGIAWGTGKFISEEEHRELVRRCNPELGDILLAKSGSLGNVAIIDRSHQFSLFESLCLIKHDREQIEGQFLTGLLRAPSMLAHLLGKNKGVAIKHLHLVDVRNLRIPLPPILLQREFARRVTAVEALKKAQRASLAELDALFATLQYRAFRGEL